MGFISASYNVVPVPAFEPDVPKHDTIGGRIKLYVQENFPEA